MESKMHLNAKQIFTLFIPFFIALIAYIFDFDIVKNIKYFFPTYKEYKNKSLDKKATIYLQIESKDKLYQKIQHDIQQRKEDAKWIAQYILYKKLPKAQVHQVHTQKLQTRPNKQKKPNILKLEAVFSKDKVAIINGKIVKEGTFINHTKILKIFNDKVLIQQKRGKRWLYLFH